MLNTYVPDWFTNNIAKCFIVIALFVPAFISKKGSLYYPDYILSVFLILILSFLIFQWKDLKYNRKKLLPFLLIGMLFIYDLVTSFVNLTKLHWYNDAINVSICFGFLIVLLLSENSDRIFNDKMIKFLMNSVIVSNIAAMIVFIRGYYGVWFMNGHMIWPPIDPEYYEVRFNWIYHHKCEYAFMLVCFIALFFVYRRLFKNVYTFALSVAFLFACIFVSHTLTSLVSALFVVAGFGMDMLIENKNKLKKQYLLAVIPIGAVLAALAIKIGKERRVYSLGKRLPIWNGVIPYIRSHFWGMGHSFGVEKIPCPLNNKDVYNGHNVFLNQMLRFSIPVGIIFTLIFVIIILATIINRKNFLILGIWVAMLLPMNMDYCMLTNSLPMVILVIYCIGFRNLNTPALNKKFEFLGFII